jgi:hypothetical protein
MTDIVKRLRAVPKLPSHRVMGQDPKKRFGIVYINGDHANSIAELCNRTADEIERLRATLEAVSKVCHVATSARYADSVEALFVQIDRTARAALTKERP